MKHTRLIMLLVLGGLIASSNASAIEGEKLTAVSWNVGLATEDMKTFVDNTSMRGFGLQGRWFVRSRLSLGLLWEWQVFDYSTKEAIETSGITVSGQQYRYVNAFPFLATAHLYLGRPGATRLYVGGGAGAYYIMKRLEIGLVAIDDDNWHWGVAPEAGLLLPIGDMYGHQNLMVAGKLNFAVGTDDSIDFTWYEVVLGITWNPEF
jgi:hypothetical protein